MRYPTTLPPREVQDAHADRIRRARIDARAWVAAAGGVGFSAYLAAMRHSVTLNPRTVGGSILRGCGSRHAAGVRTLDALDLLARGDVQAAAELDLDADPGCHAIDWARTALIERIASGEATPDDREARAAIREFDRVVGLAVADLACLGEKLARCYFVARRKKDMPPSGLGLDDATAVVLEGVRKSCCSYRQGNASLATFAQRHGWVLRALQDAEPDIETLPVDDVIGQEDPRPSSQGGAIRNRGRTGKATVYTPGLEVAIVDAEATRARDRLYEAFIEAGAAVRGRSVGVDAVRRIVRGEQVGKRQWAPAVKVLRGLWEQGAVRI